MDKSKAEKRQSGSQLCNNAQISELKLFCAKTFPDHPSNAVSETPRKAPCKGKTHWLIEEGMKDQAKVANLHKLQCGLDLSANSAENHLCPTADYNPDHYFAGRRNKWHGKRGKMFWILWMLFREENIATCPIWSKAEHFEMCASTRLLPKWFAVTLVRTPQSIDISSMTRPSLSFSFLNSLVKPEWDGGSLRGKFSVTNAFFAR